MARILPPGALDPFLASLFAWGLGGFSNMAEIFRWPSGFGGRFLGYEINLTTLTLQPTVAFRPLPWLSLGVGIDIVPASIELKQAINFGAAEGAIHTSGTATGVGGNLGLYIRAVPRWLAHGDHQSGHDGAKREDGRRPSSGNRVSVDQTLRDRSGR